MSDNKAISGYVKACLELTGKVKKDGQNPHFKSGYATLDAVLETILPACRSHKIVPLQEIIPAEGGIAVKTTIYHEDGDKLELQPMPIPVDKNSAHGVVSASTYGRRVSLMAIFGLAPSDDDGNAAVESSEAEINILVDKVKEAITKGDWATLEMMGRDESWLDVWGKIDNQKKGKIKELVKKVTEYRDQLNEFAAKDDSGATLETWDEMERPEQKAVWATLSENTQHYITKLKKPEAA